MAKSQPYQYQGSRIYIFLYNL